MRARHAPHASMIAALDEAFDQHQERGVVKLDFDAIGCCYALPPR